MIFRYETIQGQAAASWPAIYKQAAKYKHGIIEVRPFDAKREISNQQMKWFHAVPVAIYAEATGYTRLESERHLKLECGAEWFRRDYDDDRGQAGEVLFECGATHCQNLFPRPLRIGGIYQCPLCGCLEFQPLYLLSKTELSVNEFSDFMENCADYLNSLGWNCPMPDPQWRINEKQKVKVKA